MNTIDEQKIRRLEEKIEDLATKLDKLEKYQLQNEEIDK